MKVILDCPYEQRNQVKALGARWDPAIKKWYVVDPPDLAPFAPWLPADAADFIVQNHATSAAAPAHRKEAKALQPPQRRSGPLEPPSLLPLAPWPASDASADEGPPWD